jgi:type I restriction enzyme S subunit
LELSGAKAKQIPIPLAPFDQQKLIVAEIEKQFSRLGEAVAGLKRIKANLKRYKAAVLKAAVEGKLTEEWRKAHPNAETGADLLKRILAEREKKWEEKNPGKKYKEPVAPDTSSLPDLQKGWVWSSPEILAQLEDNAICAGPFGTIFKAKDFRSEGIPIIFLRHVAPGKYLTHKPGFMDENKWKELFQSYSVYGGELLITKLGEPPGICAIYPFDIGPAMVTPDVMKMSVNGNFAEAHYLMYYFNSQVASNISSDLAFGTKRLRLTLPIFRKLSIPLPPLVEQKQIIDEVESLLSISEEIDAALETNLTRADSLRQSILKEAFNGKLLHTE